MLATLSNTLQQLSDNPVANLLAMGRDPYGLMERMYRRHGDMFQLRTAGLEPLRVCADPEGVRQIVTGGYAQFERHAGGVDLFAGPHSLILTHGDTHRSRRKLMSPAFSGDSIRAFGPKMAAITGRVLDDFTPGRTMALLDPMQEITLRVILRCVFGITAGPRLEELRLLVMTYLGQIFSPEALALAVALTPAGAQRWFMGRSGAARRSNPTQAFTPSRWPLQRIADCLGRIHALLAAEIDRCAAEGPATRDDVLALLMQARFEDGQGMAREELLEQLLLLLIGGYETTSISLCWAAHCLMHHPASLARVRAEVDSVMGDGPVDPSRVRELPYLGAVISESMRLYPIAIGIARRARMPMHIAGCALAPGELVMASIYLTQRNPETWPDADRFKPERMLGRRAAAWQLLPFGGGTWRCLGAAFAEFEMRIVLAEMFTRFELAPEGAPVRPVQHGITIGPSGGLRVRVAAVRPLATSSGVTTGCDTIAACVSG